MLELARLLGTPQKIILQTRRGQNIDNSQSCTPDEMTIRRYNLLRSKHASWRNRKQPCGFYNCFGLVWASRRTSIYEESEISKILIDDGYRQITEVEMQPGDIVLYRFQGNTLHAAMFIEFREIQLGKSPVPWVLSKWGDVFGEDFHPINDVPGHFEGCHIEIWTDRI